jgi:hypothetical protein
MKCNRTNNLLIELLVASVERLEAGSFQIERFFDPIRAFK